MDLPDFSKDKQFIQLRKDMGITEEEYELKKAKLHERHINDLETGTSHSKPREE